jgi:hypothetical protein
MKLRQTFCCYFFSYPAKSFTLPSTSYYIWSCDKLFAVIFSLIQLKVFHSFNFISYMKLRQTFCCYFFSHSAKSFSFIQLHIQHKVWQSICFFFFSHSIKQFSFVFVQLHIVYRMETIYLLIHFTIVSDFVCHTFICLVSRNDFTMASLSKSSSYLFEYNYDEIIFFSSSLECRSFCCGFYSHLNWIEWIWILNRYYSSMSNHLFWVFHIIP